MLNKQWHAMFGCSREDVAVEVMVDTARDRWNVASCFECGRVEFREPHEHQDYEGRCWMCAGKPDPYKEVE